MKFKKAVHILLLSVFCVGVLMFPSACGSKENSINIFSTYNTLKVMQSGGEYPDLGKTLDVFMAKGETEGAQLIVTPEKKVSNIKLTAADLTSPSGAVFAKQNITVYFQMCINVQVKTPGQTNFKYPAGYTPDMLLPMETAEKYGENSIAAGKNQGFTVEFKTDANTAAGIYRGTFTLDADGKVFDIPVKLEVFDIDVTGANGMTSIRAISFDYMNGEYNNSPEMYQAYYETAMNDYKFMFDALPGARDPKQMAQSAIKYWDNPNFTSFNIPAKGYSSQNIAIDKTLIKGDFYSYMYELAKASTPDRILFDKAYIYPMHLDEVRSAAFPAARANTTAIYEIQDLVYADLIEEGYFNDFPADYKQKFYQSITGIPITITVDNSEPLQKLDSDINTYCVRFEELHTSSSREQYASVKTANENRGGETWFYTCMQPIYPYPSHHIDDSLLGSRVMRWMQKDYDLKGYLHWAFNSYHIYTGSEVLNCDPYAEASRFPDTVGDGFMIYPGKKYGIDTFLPSVRLTTFRDGQEDYDMLCVLDKTIAEKESFYNLPSGTVSSKTYVEDLYKSLYNGTVYNDDDALLYSARKTLAQTVQTHRSDTKFLVNTKLSNSTLTATSDIYLANDYEITVNGKRLRPLAASGSGTKYTVTQTLEKDAVLDIVITKGGVKVETHNIFVSSETRNIALTTENSPIYLSETSEVSYIRGTADITLKSKGGSLNDILMFVPSVGISGSAFNVSLDKVDTITFDITNNSTNPLYIKARLKAGYNSYDLSAYTILAGETKTITINEIYNYSSVFASLSQSTFELYTENADANNVLLDDRLFTLANLSYSVKKGAV